MVCEVTQYKTIRGNRKENKGRNLHPTYNILPIIVCRLVDKREEEINDQYSRISRTKYLYMATLSGEVVFLRMNDPFACQSWALERRWVVVQSEAAWIPPSSTRLILQRAAGQGRYTDYIDIYLNNRW